MANKLNAGLIGAICGVTASLLSHFLCNPLETNSQIKVFQREGKPNAMRIYRFGADQVLGEDPKSKGTYIPFSKYLETIKDPPERKIEEGEIEKAVNWYKD